MVLFSIQKYPRFTFTSRTTIGRTLLKRCDKFTPFFCNPQLFNTKNTQLFITSTTFGLKAY